MRANEEHRTLRTRLEWADVQIDLTELPMMRSPEMPLLTVPDRVTAGEISAVVSELNLPSTMTTPQFPKSWVVGWVWGEAKPIQQPAEKCLDAFLKLAELDSKDEASVSYVVAFVQKWGPLRNPIQGLGINYDFEEGPHYIEIARKVRALLQLAADLYEQKRGSVEDWEAALWPALFNRLRWQAENPDVQMQRGQLAQVVSALLGEAGLFPVIEWGEKEPQAFFRWTAPKSFYIMYPRWDGTQGVIQASATHPDGTGTVFQAVILQLASALMSPNGIAKCGSCGVLFVPGTRKGRGGGKHFCRRAECKREGQRQRDRAYRRNRRAQSKTTLQ